MVTPNEGWIFRSKHDLSTRKRSTTIVENASAIVLQTLSNKPLHI